MRTGSTLARPRHSSAVPAMWCWAPCRRPRWAAPAGGRLGPADAAVSSDARVSDGTTVGYRAVIESGAVVAGSVLFDGASVGPGAVVRNSIVGRDASISGRAVL